MVGRRAFGGLLAAAGLMLITLAVRADTFTNKKTGATLEGRLLGTATQNGKEALVVRVGREIKRLPADEWTVQKAEPAPAPPPPAKQAEKDTPKDTAEARPRYEYRGRSVTEEWLGHHYARFSDKIAFVGGRYYDVAETKLKEPEITALPPPVGSARLPCSLSRPAHYKEAKVLKVLGEGEAILVRPAIKASSRAPGLDEVTFHVKGLPPNQTQVDATFNDWLIYVGPYRDGSTTLQSYVVHQPLTKEQFADALAGGFKLVDYEVSELRYHIGHGDKRDTRIIAKPVP